VPDSEIVQGNDEISNGSDMDALAGWTNEAILTKVSSQIKPQTSSLLV
jgi:hypothetical protein